MWALIFLQGMTSVRLRSGKVPLVSSRVNIEIPKRVT
jgi:hypothetical protein